MRHITAEREQRIYTDSAFREAYFSDIRGEIEGKLKDTLSKIGSGKFNPGDLEFLLEILAVSQKPTENTPEKYAYNCRLYALQAIAGCALARVKERRALPYLIAMAGNENWGCYDHTRLVIDQKGEVITHGHPLHYRKFDAIEAIEIMQDKAAVPTLTSFLDIIRQNRKGICGKDIFSHAAWRDYDFFNYERWFQDARLKSSMLVMDALGAIKDTDSVKSIMDFQVDAKELVDEMPENYRQPYRYSIHESVIYLRNHTIRALEIIGDKRAISHLQELLVNPYRPSLASKVFRIGGGEEYELYKTYSQYVCRIAKMALQNIQNDAHSQNNSEYHQL